MALSNEYPVQVIPSRMVYIVQVTLSGEGMGNQVPCPGHFVQGMEGTMSEWPYPLSPSLPLKDKTRKKKE